ncbi:acyltransferase [Citrobacter sp. RHB25-C09]|uniref:acyltransferase n=1 Tax=Citrobacter sp. RHB25-C09 TaxID=2742624 RepID=UPI0015EE7E57|nr:acyltransferase [Citrobacter sp. RHB25-C09]QMI05664.1 acyltransferase [Citrobacter sp. RHB25-C09]
MGCYTDAELKSLGFKVLGKNIKVSNKASFYNAENITLGDNVRIDDFCVLSAGSGGIEVGKNVHIAVFSSLIGAGRIVVSDYCNISSRVSIYSSSDDYSGAFMSNPTIPPEYTNVYSAPVLLKEHVLIGSGSIILPGITLEKGVAVGALSLVKNDMPEFVICAGQPAKIIKSRKRELLSLQMKMKANG